MKRMYVLYSPIEMMQKNGVVILNWENSAYMVRNYKVVEVENEN